MTEQYTELPPSMLKSVDFCGADDDVAELTRVKLASVEESDEESW